MVAEYYLDGSPSLKQRLGGSFLFGVLAAIAGDAMAAVLRVGLNVPVVGLYFLPSRPLLPIAYWLQLHFLPGEGWGLFVAFAAPIALAIPFWTALFAAIHFAWYSGKLKRSITDTVDS